MSKEVPPEGYRSGFPKPLVYVQVITEHGEVHWAVYHDEEWADCVNLFPIEPTIGKVVGWRTPVISWSKEDDGSLQETKRKTLEAAKKILGI